MQCTMCMSIFGGMPKMYQAHNFVSAFFPIFCLSLYLVLALIEEFEIEGSLRLSCIKLNMTLILHKCDFYLSPHATLRNTKEVMKHSIPTNSLIPLNLNKNVSKSDFKISKQISLVTVLSVPSRFACEIELILLKDVATALFS